MEPATGADLCRYTSKKEEHEMPQHDDHDDLAALDFSAEESDSDASADSDALDFSPAADHAAEEPAVDTLDEYAPAELEDTGSELEAIDSVTESAEDAEVNEEDGVQLFTMTNPPDTVSVSALMDGRTHRVELSPKAAAMSESELADEILVLAGLARQKGLAGQHTFLLENEDLSESMHEMGLDGSGLTRDFVEKFMKLSTPEEAEAAQAEVFAARYADNK